MCEIAAKKFATIFAIAVANLIKHCEYSKLMLIFMLLAWPIRLPIKSAWWVSKVRLQKGVVSKYRHNAFGNLRRYGNLPFQVLYREVVSWWGYSALSANSMR